MDIIDDKYSGGRLKSHEENAEVKRVSVVYLVSQVEIKRQDKTQAATYELAFIYLPKKTEAALI